MKRVLLLVMCCWLAFFVKANTIVATVSAYNAVAISGDAPDVEATYMQYQNTHYKSRLVAGDSLVLKMSNMPSGQLSRVRLMMRSNKESGAGSLRLLMNGQDVWSISGATFADAAWYGSYSTDYVSVSFVPSGLVSMGDLRLSIVATANSLYFQEIVLEYTEAVARPEPYTVWFATEGPFPPGPRTEVQAGMGVVLPECLNTATDWTFVGWTEDVVTSTNECPIYMQAGTIYYPKKNQTLHALYTNLPLSPIVTPQDTLFASGEYALVMLNLGDENAALMKGMVVSGRVDALPVSLKKLLDGRYAIECYDMPSSARYQLDFEDDSVHITHSASGHAIGYTQSIGKSTLSQSDVAWHWQKAESNTLFLSHDCTPSGDCRLLALNQPNDLSKPAYVADIDATLNLSWTYTALFPVAGLPTEEAERVWSSYPTQADVMEVASAAIQWNEALEIYSLHGIQLGQTINSLRDLPSGYWLIKQGAKCVRVFVP